MCTLRSFVRLQSPDFVKHLDCATLNIITHRSLSCFLLDLLSSFLQFSRISNLPIQMCVYLLIDYLQQQLHNNNNEKKKTNNR